MTYRTHIYGQKVRGLYVDATVTRCNNPRNFMQKRFTKMIKMAVLLFKKKWVKYDHQTTTKKYVDCILWSIDCNTFWSGSITDRLSLFCTCFNWEVDLRVVIRCNMRSWEENQWSKVLFAIKVPFLFQKTLSHLATPQSNIQIRVKITNSVSVLIIFYPTQTDKHQTSH